MTAEGLSTFSAVIWELGAHSVRKYFRTQMATLGVERDYNRYVIGQTIGTYHGIRMKGIEFLRGIYSTANRSIRSKTSISKIEAPKRDHKSIGTKPSRDPH